LFDHEPTILRVGAYSVDPVRFAAIVDRHPGAGPMLGTATRETGDRRTDPAAEWAVKQAVLRALGAPIRLRARWPEMEASQDEDGRWRVTSRGPVRQFHEAHTLGHVDVTVTEADGRITAFAVLTRDLTMPPSPLPGPADLPDRVLSADVNGPTDPTEY
jgi:phosphopantetheinyl transferase (holo-ACP synthase)